MAIPSQKTRQNVKVPAGQTLSNIVIGFKFLDSRYIRVYKNSAAISGYSIAGNTVNFSPSIAGACTVSVVNEQPISRDYDITKAAEWSSDTVNLQLDYLQMQLQRVWDSMGLVLRPEDDKPYTPADMQNILDQSISSKNTAVASAAAAKASEQSSAIHDSNAKQSATEAKQYRDQAEAIDLGYFKQDGQGAVNRLFVDKVREIVSVKDFGAVGDGVTNDTDAFNRCAMYIESIGGGVINIPKGTYIVGKQDSGYKAGERYYRPRPMMIITGCANPVRIVGNGAYLKIANGLHFGSFDNTTGLPTTGINTDSLKVANIGVVIGGYNNASFSVENLTIDGNSPNAIIGGQWGDTGYQCIAYGVQVANNIITDIANVKTINHCLDGMAVGNITTAATPIMPVKLSNIISTGNARQGCSWTGGNMLLAENCIFSNTGRVVNIGTGVRLASSPGAGFDIEAEGSIIRNGTFINCIFANNNGAGMVADSGDSADCQFIGCKFYGAYYYSIWPKKPNFTFINCLVAGAVVNVFTSYNQTDKTKFYNCKFSAPESYEGVDALYGQILVDCSSQNPEFFNCSFYTTSSIMRLPASSSSTRYENCYFYQNGSSGAVYTKGTFVGINQMTVETGTVDLSGSIYINSIKYSGAVSPSGVFVINGIGQASGLDNAFLNLIIRGNNGNTGVNQTITSVYAPPSSGDHARGEIIINPNPSAGGFFGWVCVTSGNPGTWKTFGQISS